MSRCVNLSPGCLFDGRPELTDDHFKVLSDTWIRVAMLDADRRTVGVAFLDQGFAPNPDFAPFPDDLVRECNMGTTPPSCGPGTWTDTRGPVDAAGAASPYTLS